MTEVATIENSAETLAEQQAKILDAGRDKMRTIHERLYTKVRKASASSAVAEEIDHLRKALDFATSIRGFTNLENLYRRGDQQPSIKQSCNEIISIFENADAHGRDKAAKYRKEITKYPEIKAACELTLELCQNLHGPQQRKHLQDVQKALENLFYEKCRIQGEKSAAKNQRREARERWITKAAGYGAVFLAGFGVGGTVIHQADESSKTPDSPPSHPTTIQVRSHATEEAVSFIHVKIERPGDSHLERQRARASQSGATQTGPA